MLMFRNEAAILVPSAEPSEGVREAYQAYDDVAALSTAFHESFHGVAHVGLGSPLAYIDVIPDGRSTGRTVTAGELTTEVEIITVMAGVLAAFLTDNSGPVFQSTRNDVGQIVLAAVIECAPCTPPLEIVVEPGRLDAKLRDYWASTCRMMLEPPSILAVQAITIALLQRGRLDGERITAIDAAARAQPIPTIVAHAVDVLLPNMVLHGNHTLPLWARGFLNGTATRLNPNCYPFLPLAEA
jgi:hypothetical protein